MQNQGKHDPGCREAVFSLQKATAVSLCDTDVRKKCEDHLSLTASSLAHMQKS